MDDVDMRTWWAGLGNAAKAEWCEAVANYGGVTGDLAESIDASHQGPGKWIIPFDSSSEPGERDNAGVHWIMRNDFHTFVREQCGS